MTTDRRSVSIRMRAVRPEGGPVTHRVEVSQPDGWSWRAVCVCGYRSKHWDTRDQAAGAGDGHLVRMARRAEPKDRPTAPHRTRMTPRRFV